MTAFGVENRSQRLPQVDFSARYAVVAVGPFPPREEEVDWIDSFVETVRSNLLERWPVHGGVRFVRETQKVSDQTPDPHSQTRRKGRTNIYHILASLLAPLQRRTRPSQNIHRSEMRWHAAFRVAEIVPQLKWSDPQPTQVIGPPQSRRTDLTRIAQRRNTRSDNCPTNFERAFRRPGAA
jgi:hypothetical protein